MIGIYKITSPSGKVYIGQSKNIEKRFITYSYLDCKSQPKLYNSFKKYGIKTHQFEIIEKCKLDDLFCKERYWQEYYDVIGKNGLNCLLAICGDVKQVLSEEVKLKISNSRKGKGKRFGKDNPMYKKIVSEETRLKLSIASKGKIHLKGKDSPLYGIRGKDHYNYGRKGNLNKNFGKKRSQETLINMSKGLNKSYENFNHNKSNILLSQNTGIFYSVKEATVIYNIKYSYLMSMISGNRKNKTDLIKC